MRVTLTRTTEGDSGTFGTIQIEGHDHAWKTGELPWRGNEENVSRIPAGTYQAEVAHSAHFNRDLYHVLDVPGRGAVEIHQGNWCGDKAKGYRSDVLGCIILGDTFGQVMGQDAVVSSMDAVAAFMEATQGQPITLTIQEAFA